MENWQKSLQKSIHNVEILEKRFGINSEKLRAAAQAFKFRISPYYFNLIKQAGDPFFLQCVPDERELEVDESLMDDPLDEERNSPAPCVVHRYPDRCLLLVSDQCATYCRFCTRKRKFRTQQNVSMEAINQGIDYISATSVIRDVLVSGGDPFLLCDEKIEAILSRLRTIKHVEIIRIGTRTPCVLPERITLKLTRMLKKYHPLFINVHFNHPDELTPQAQKALRKLADAGIPLGSQTVLLKGVNDSPEIIMELMQKLLAARVRPYYLLQSDLVYGTTHFRTPVETALKIMRSLRGWTTGMAVPHCVIDLPNGGGKIPLVPEYIENCQDKLITIRNYRGELYQYPDIE